MDGVAGTVATRPVAARLINTLMVCGRTPQPSWVDGELSSIVGEGKTGHDTCPRWKGPRRNSHEEYRGRAILWFAVTRIDIERRAAIHVLRLAGPPYRISQQSAASLLLRRESNGSSSASAGVACPMDIRGPEFRAAAHGREFADVVALAQVRQTEADLRALQHFAGVFHEPMSKRVASANILRAADLGGRGQKCSLGSARGDLKNLSGIESALHRISVRATHHPRPSNQARDTYQNSVRDSYLCSGSDGEIQVAYSACLAKKREFHSEYRPSLVSLRNDKMPPVGTYGQGSHLAQLW